MSNNNDSVLEQILTKQRTRIKYQPANKPSKKEQATTAGENLFGDFAPTARGGRGSHSLGSSWRRFLLFIVAALVSGLLTVLFIIGPHTIGLPLNHVLRVKLPVLSLGLREAIIVSVAIFLSAFLTVYLYLWTRQLITYEKTGSLVLSTAGDGTVQASFIGSGIFTGRFKCILESFDGHATITREKCSYGDLLGVTDVDGSIPEDFEPYVAEFRFHASQPFDALGIGTRTDELLTAGGTDLPTDAISATLAKSDIPVALQCAIGARPKDSGRATAVKNRIDRKRMVASKAAATWRDEDTGVDPLARVFDLTVRVLAFERAGADTTVEHLCREIATAIEGPTNDGVTSVTYNPVSANEGFFSNPRLAALQTKPNTVLKRLDSNAVVYTRAHVCRGALTAAGWHSRANLPVTPAEVWRYLLPGGDGLTDSKRAHGAQRRDQTPTGRPPEHAQDHFRADDGRLAQERDKQASDTPRDEHT